MLRLHDYVLSADCYKVRLFLSLLGLGYETVAVDFFPGRQHLSQAYLALNPAGSLPILEDGAKLIADPLAILVHLANVRDRSGRWSVRSWPDEMKHWLGFAGYNLRPLAAMRLSAIIGTPLDREAARAASRKALRQLDDHLADRSIVDGEWLAGDAATIADIACFPDVALSHDCGIGHEDYPAINLWQRRVRKLPGFIGMPGIPDYF